MCRPAVQVPYQAQPLSPLVDDQAMSRFDNHSGISDESEKKVVQHDARIVQLPPRTVPIPPRIVPISTPQSVAKSVHKTISEDRTDQVALEAHRLVALHKGSALNDPLDSVRLSSGDPGEARYRSGSV